MNLNTEPLSLNVNHKLMLEWISFNKPESLLSDKITQLFIEQAIITGSEKFILKTKKTIRQASQLTTGITVLQHLLRSGNKIKIMESEESSFSPLEGLFFLLKPVLAFHLHQTHALEDTFLYSHLFLQVECAQHLFQEHALNHSVFLKYSF